MVAPALAALVIAASARGQLPQPAADMLAMLPPQAEAALVVPSLNRLSKEIARLLEGMDRGQLLLGSRPIDQVKSATGFIAGIDDMGGAAAILLPSSPPSSPPSPSATGAAPEAFRLVLLLPITDAQAFLDGNFVRREGEAYIDVHGNALHVKPLASGKHLALSLSANAIRDFDSGLGLARDIENELGARGVALAAGADAFILTRAGAAERAIGALAKAFRAHLPENSRPDAAALASGAALARGMEWGLVAFDFDPLALVLRTAARFEPQSDIGRLTRGGAAGAPSLANLPNKPLLLAAALDVSGAGGAEAARGLAASFGLPATPAWLLESTAIEFAAYPSAAGLAGGLLNDAMLVLSTPQPQRTIDVMKAELLAQLATGGDSAPTAAWEDNKPVRNAGAASAYQVPTSAPILQGPRAPLISSLLFGSAGWRGFVKQMPDSVIVTFSQRPAVVEAAVQAHDAPPDDRGVLSGSPVVRAMRNWMPPRRDIEAYVGAGELGRLVQQIIDSLRLDVQLPAGRWESGMPPIGLAIEIDNHQIESATIVPAAVLAVLLDQALASRAGATAVDGEGRP